MQIVEHLRDNVLLELSAKMELLIAKKEHFAVVMEESAHAVIKALNVVVVVDQFVANLRRLVDLVDVA